VTLYDEIFIVNFTHVVANSLVAESEGSTPLLKPTIGHDSERVDTYLAVQNIRREYDLVHKTPLQ
jgi:hypothetical protein